MNTHMNTGLMKPKPILIFLGILEKGGTEMGLLRNMPLLRQQGFDVQICALSNTGSLIPHFREAGVPLHLPARNAPGGIWGGCIGRFLYKGYQLWHVVRTLRRVRPAVFHCFLPHAYVIGALAMVLSLYRGAWLYSRPSLNDYQETRPIIGFIERRILHRFVTLAIGNSGKILQQLQDEGVPQSRLLLLHNGLDATRYEAGHITIPEELHQLKQRHDLMMTVVANLHPYKGHDDLLAALSLIKKDLPEKWCVVCAGRDEKDQQKALLDKVKDYGLGGHVHFMGPSEHVPALLQLSDLHIHPSHQEGLPNSVIEATLSGCPVIATDVGGTADIIRHGETGLLVPPRDPQGLAAAIQVLVADTALARRLGNAGLAHSKAQFALTKSVAAYTKVYSAWVNQSVK